MFKPLIFVLYLALFFLISPIKTLAITTVNCQLNPTSSTTTQQPTYTVTSRGGPQEYFDFNVYNTDTQTLYTSYGSVIIRGGVDFISTIGPFPSGNYRVFLQPTTGDQPLACPIDFTVYDTSQPPPSTSPSPLPSTVASSAPTVPSTYCYMPDLDNLGRLPNLPILYRGKSYKILLSNSLPDTQYSIKFDATAYPLLPKTDTKGNLNTTFALEIHSGFANGPHEVTFEPNISDNTQRLINTCSLSAFGGGIKNNSVDVKSPIQLLDYGTCNLHTTLGLPDLPLKITNDNCKNGATATIDTSTIIAGCVCKPSGPLPTGFYLDRQTRTCASCQLTDPKCQYTDITACNKALSDLNSQTGTTPKASPAVSGGKQCGNDKDPAIATAIGCIHTSPIGLVQDLLKFLVAISGGLALLMMILGAFGMITSAGNPETLKAGQDRFTSAFIGLLFVILSIVLLKFIGVDILGIL